MFGYPLVAEPRRTFTTFFAALLTILTIVSSGLRASAQTVDVNKETDLSVAQFYLPTLAKKFPPGRQTSCPAKCKGAQDKLNKLWHKLYIHDYATLAELRPWHTAVEKSNSSAENTVHAKLVKKYGKSFTIHDLEGELETILADIAFAAYDLEQCEKKCNQAGQPPSVTGTPPPTPPPQPPTATGVKLPPPPGKCASDAELKAYQQQLDNIKSDLQGKRRGLLKNQSATDKEDPNYDLFQKEIDKIDKDLKQVNDLLDKADAELKKPQAERTKIAMCLPPTEKTGDGTPGQLRGFGYVPGQPVREVSVYVSVDSRKLCTFSNEAPKEIALVPADENGNEIALLYPCDSTQHSKHPCDSTKYSERPYRCPVVLAGQRTATD